MFVPILFVCLFCCCFVAVVVVVIVVVHDFYQTKEMRPPDGELADVDVDIIMNVFVVFSLLSVLFVQCSFCVMLSLQPHFALVYCCFLLRLSILLVYFSLH